MIPLPETVGLYFLPLLKCLSIHGVLQLSIFMSNLGYGCCGDAAVQYSWKTKVLVLAGRRILILCCFVFFFLSKAWGKEGRRVGMQGQSGADMLHSRASQGCLGWKQVKKRWKDRDLFFRDLGRKEDGCSIPPLRLAGSRAQGERSTSLFHGLP